MSGAANPERPTNEPDARAPAPLAAGESLRDAVAAARAAGTDRRPSELIPWAHALLGDGLMMSTAFGKSGMCILHLVHELQLPIPIYFIDTAYHFPETIEYADQLRRDWGLELILERPKIYGVEFVKKFGDKMYETDPDFCCQKNKVEPFSNLLQRYRGWITGVRRDQSSTRATAEPIEILEGGKLKLQPLAFWTRDDVDDYIARHKIPLHPLFSQGYTSIGCAPCTRPNADAANERAGRWAGKAKTECGLHTYWKKKGKDVSPTAADASSAGESAD